MRTLGFFFEGSIGLTTLAVLLAIVVPFGVTFAFKIAYLEYRRRRIRPGGFEVKPAGIPTGRPPVTEQEVNDHG